MTDTNKDWLDEIADNLHHSNDDIITKRKYLNQAIQSKIAEAERLARIAELDKMQELGKDNVTTFQGIIKFRLKQLKEDKS